MYNDNLYISSKFMLQDFLKLNLMIDSPQEIWNEAISIFKDRMESRFLFIIQDMVGKIKKDFSYVDYSFIIMATNCLFIETLRQFYLGINATEESKGANKKAFKDFFEKSANFNFSANQSNIFYSHIRCGILHQGQTKFNSQLTVGQNNILVSLDKKHISVDVGKFSKALISEYEIYLNNLKKEGSSELKINFIKKMNYLTNKS